IPSIPAGYTTITSTAGTQQACAAGWRVSPGGETSTGTWTNATQVVAMVYSGASVVGTTSLNPGSSTTPTTVNTAMQDSSGASTALFLCGAKSATTGLTTAPPSYTNRTNVTTACGCDALGVTGFGTVAITVSPTTRWFVLSVEVKVAPPNPYFVAAGAAVSGTTSINPAFPAGVLANDIALLIAQSSNQTITCSGTTEIDTQTH